MSDDIVAGEQYDIAFSYSPDGIALYVDGVLEDSDEGFPAGMVGNDNSTVIGASARRRNDKDDNVEWEFDGTISNVAVLDEDISAFDAVLLAGNDNDPAVLGATGGEGPAPEPEPDTETVTMELGYERILQPDRGTWVQVSFEQEIEDAVVVMGPLEGNGGHEAVAHVRNVTSTGFEFQINEWSYLDGWHMEEGIGWMAVSAGTHTLASGDVISAGSAQSDTALQNAVSVSLDGFEDTPTVFAQVASDNEAGAVTTRLSDVSADQFQFMLQEEEAKTDKERAAEEVDWIALSGDIGDILDVTNVSGGLDHRWKSVTFDEVAGETVVLADMQTFNGTDTAGLRYRDLEAGSVDLVIQEERSRDTERWHIVEDVSILTGSAGSYILDLA